MFFRTLYRFMAALFLFHEVDAGGATATLVPASGGTRRERLERLVGEMKSFADGLDVKYATDGVPDLNERQELDRRAAEIKSLVEEIKSKATTDGTIDMAKAFLGDLAGAPAPQAAPGGGEVEVHATGVANPKGMTLGEAVVKSPGYAEFLGQYQGADGQIMSGLSNLKAVGLKVDGFGNRGMESKTVVTGASSTSGGALVVNERTSIITDLVGERELFVDDLCTHIPLGSDTFEYVTVTSKTNNAAAVPEAITAANPALVTPDAQEIIDGGYKPESALALAVVSSPVETIAHLIPLTRRAAADAPQLRAMVDQFLLYGLKEEREDQLLNGSGTSPNHRGILNVVGINTVGSAGTDLDAVVDAIRVTRVTGRRRPTAMVVHPNDWFSTGFLLAKDSTGRYIIGDPNMDINVQQALWGLRVVVSEAMTENTLLIGDFRQAVVADRQQSAIYITDSHKDWFQRNLLALLAEERFGFGVLDPQAFTTVTAV